jgi:hypothetical protein
VTGGTEENHENLKLAGVCPRFEANTSQKQVRSIATRLTYRLIYMYYN